ncbi:hypothetical protein USDA257_c40640 [Sinorhizobium fredii USDA 257]|uniref:Uncharacterized protein n=1 Tax=Sinorhizobium fredii (strain USDA 257) TaxID=1185652 RepID=I3X9Q1_SINF2|nr:hypothetical protein USDA257_c40640 [Sinorhizobium fredii USDA 257]
MIRNPAGIAKRATPSTLLPAVCAAILTTHRNTKATQIEQNALQGKARKG